MTYKAINEDGWRARREIPLGVAFPGGVNEGDMPFQSAWIVMFDNYKELQ